MQRELVDACGRKVSVPQRPQRIVCLCPSLTETLFALDLQGQIVGRTRYCIHPQEQIASVPVVGGTKKLDFAALQAAKPDLILAEKEENRREDVEAMSQHWPVYVYDIQTLPQAQAAIVSMGELCDRRHQAQMLSTDINQAWQALRPSDVSRRVLYLIWRKPWMAAGKDTYIDAVLQHLGWTNVAVRLPGRYPQIETDQLRDLNADLCLLSSEPYPFTDKHQQELSPLLPTAQIECVDGEMFSWYGSRMLQAADHLAQLQQRLK